MELGKQFLVIIIIIFFFIINPWQLRSLGWFLTVGEGTVGCKHVYFSLAEFPSGHPLVSAIPGWGMAACLSRYHGYLKRNATRGRSSNRRRCASQPTP